MTLLRSVCFASCALLSLCIGLGTAIGATRGIWISPADIMALPTAGTAWDNVRAAAYRIDWGKTDLKIDGNAFTGGYCLAAALVWVRTGDPALRARVRDTIRVAKRGLDEALEFQAAPNTIGISKFLCGIVIAADLIDLQAFDPTFDSEFRGWLDTVRTANFPRSNPHSPNMTYSFERGAHGWAQGAGNSLIAASLYLGDVAYVSRAARIFEAFCGNREAYPPNANDGKAYFNKTGCLDPDWLCDSAGWPNPTNWKAISDSCQLTLDDGNQVNPDGALLENVSRNGPGTCDQLAQWPPTAEPTMMYVWEGMQRVFISAEMLHRAGYPAYEWEKQALKRAMDFCVRAGWQMKYQINRWVPWVANRRYGTSYPTLTPIASYSIGWTDWTHGAAGTPNDLLAPAAITDLTSP